MLLLLIVYGHILCHILATGHTHPTKLHAMGARFFYLRDVETIARLATLTLSTGCLRLPRMRDDRTLLDPPCLQDTLHRGFESGRKRLLDLILITQIVTFCHRCLIRIIEQWREPLDIVVWLLQQFGDGDWVVEGTWQTQKH